MRVAEPFFFIGAVLVFLMPSLVMALAIPYGVLRSRDGRDGPPDPQLGLKVALHFFFSASVLMTLLGVSVLVASLMVKLARLSLEPESFPTEIQRICFAVSLSGTLFSLVHLFCLLTLTKRSFRSPARRIFLGCRFAAATLAVMTLTTTLLIVLAQERSDQEVVRATLGMLMVWGPAWIVHLMLLRFGRPAVGQTLSEGTVREGQREWEA